VPSSNRVNASWPTTSSVSTTTIWLEDRVELAPFEHGLQPGALDTCLEAAGDRRARDRTEHRGILDGCGEQPGAEIPRGSAFIELATDLQEPDQLVMREDRSGSDQVQLGIAERRCRLS
jgi:hypothetical protein